MKKIFKTKEQWMRELPLNTYQVCIEGNTEIPFSGELHNFKEDGIYTCTCCTLELFNSSSKFDSKSGWPSFFKTITPNAIIELNDTKHNLIRTEVRCAQCDSHLGHLFNDGPKPTQLRYCINSLSLNFKPRDTD